MKFIYVLLLVCSISFAQDNFDKYMSSELRAEVYSQRLVDSGEYEKSKVFLEKATKKYPHNEILLMFSGTTYYNLKELHDAKNYFILALEKNPANEQASAFIKLIEEQEISKENKTVLKMIDYLNNKGLSFLMIFLAFLGSSVISRKSSKCISSFVFIAISRFENRYLLMNSKMNRIEFLLSFSYFKKDSFVLCRLINILESLTIVIALSIIFMMIEFLTGYTGLISESILTLSSESLWKHVFLVIVFFIVITSVFKFINNILNLGDNEKVYILGLKEELEKLNSKQAFVTLSKAGVELEKLTKDDLALILKYINEETKSNLFL